MATTQVRTQIYLPRKPPFEGFIGTITEGPADLAENHDHYLYGAMRRGA